MARLSVADTGIGIEPDRLEDIFEMFKQVEVGAARTRTGLGIGLALVRQLAELHGGRVAAASEGLGKGSRFTVWLPGAASDASPPVDVPSRGLGGMYLLVVDDEPDVLAVFGALLESEGAAVTVAADAQKALALAVEGRFDAVLSDIGMPVRDGHWLARQLRLDARTTDVPLVAVSGMARDADRARALEAGFDAFVGKPPDFDALRRAILDAVAGRAAA
jgi:two-component system CheB/CheR fusion protein